MMSHWSRRRALPLLGLIALLAATLAAGSPARAATCPGADALRVPGAKEQKVSCYDDLTTAGLLITGGTVFGDWFGLNATGTVNPTGVPGIQIDGYFPDTKPPAPYAPNPFNGWNHDAQFVIRLPDDWNGKLVIAPPPGNRRQYSSDFIISDWVLAQGYAYASTDKGNSGSDFYLDGEEPGDAVAEWHFRVRQLTKAAARVVERHYGEEPDKTYIAGISNGGYMVRYALENSPQLYDGGVDWEGTLFTADSANLFTYLPTALRQYPIYASPASTPEQREAARQAMFAAGFAEGSEFLWPAHNLIYWGLTQRIYRLEFDPGYTGAEADYDYASRPQEVKDAVARVSLTGNIRRPMLTLHGTLDSLLPPATDSDVYADLIAAAGREQLHRYYTIEDGNHVDAFYLGFELIGLPQFTYPDKLRPMLPCFRSAFTALEGWVEGGASPPASGFVPRPASGDIVNSCALP